MKYIFVILIISIPFFGYSQNFSDTLKSPFYSIDTIQTEILLKDSIDLLKCGFWENGDYRIFVEIPQFAITLQNDCSGLINGMQNDIKNDSVTLVLYKKYAERYLNAINQLRDSNNGFDFRRLVLYVGPENIERNKGNSVEVELYVRQQLEKGNVAVFYKGDRIYKLKYRMVKDNVMSTIKIYFDDDTNFVFSYFGYINW
ncbi:MAG: hypothetical protein WCI53_14015 [Bacteroidota bacterium]